MYASMRRAVGSGVNQALMLSRAINMEKKYLPNSTFSPTR